MTPTLLKIFEYDRYVLGSFEWKWATIVIFVSLPVDQVILSSPQFPLSLFIQPIIYSFTVCFFLNAKRTPLETYPFLLSSSEFKMIGAVPPQFQMPPCPTKESPLKILISISVLGSYRTPIFRIICTQNLNISFH